jgi:hypothetical protein
MAAPVRPVTTDGAVTCSHPPAPFGQVALSSTAQLTVNQAPVLPFSAVVEFGTYVGCAFTDGVNLGPCTKTSVIGGGQSPKLTVNGRPVLLDSLVATSAAPPPAAPVTVTAGQTLLTVSGRSSR